MPLYEEKFQREMTRIRDDVFRMGEQVEESLKNSVTSLFTKDEVLANRTILGDRQIDRQEQEIRRLCHNFIIRQQPAAGHLRTITTVMSLVGELERIGDYAVTISREAIHLSKAPEGVLRKELEKMVSEIRTMLHQSMTAFREGDSGLARGTAAMADQVGRELDLVLDELVREGNQQQLGTRDLLDLHSVAYALERVSDRAKNICEDTLFVVTGETKAEKEVRLLFVDDSGSLLAPMACAIARKQCNGSSSFTSASRAPAPALNTDMVAFMRQQGHDMSGISPAGVNQVEVGSFNIMVSLNGPVRTLVPEIPFHTAYLEWNIPDGRKLDDTYRALAQQVAQLKEMLKGEETV